MLHTSDNGTVQHRASNIHHAINKPRRSVAESAVVMLDEYLAALNHDGGPRANKLRKARDILATVVNTAY